MSYKASKCRKTCSDGHSSSVSHGDGHLIVGASDGHTASNGSAFGFTRPIATTVVDQGSRVGDSPVGESCHRCIMVVEGSKEIA